MITDYHVHSAISPDAGSPMKEICRAALEAGVEELVFTDHYEFYSGGVTRPFFHEEYIKNYFIELEQCRKELGMKLKILSGMEFGQPQLEHEKADQYLQKYKFDYVIGSVHKLENVDVGKMEYTRNNRDDILNNYYHMVLDMVKVSDFDCVGHLDLVKRHLSKEGIEDGYEVFRPVIEEILKVVIQRGKGIEVNTSGLRQGMGETMPSLACLLRYRELGGEIVTVGSDAHRKEDVGKGISEAYSLLRQAGFRKVARFEGRTLFFSPLPENECLPYSI